MTNAKRTVGLTLEKAVEDCGWIGRIVCIHEIGPYSIVEYVQKDIQNSDSNGSTFYSVLIDGERTSNSRGSLDEALIYAIAKRNLKEPNTATWMARAATQLIIPGEATP